MHLYAIYQRTQSESKSQHGGIGSAGAVSVCNLSKNTIWKQITTMTLHHLPLEHLYAIYQRTQSESKSQRDFTTLSSRVICMQSIKEHNLKANHNSKEDKVPAKHSVCNLSKNTIWKQITTIIVEGEIDALLYAIYQRTQSESKSQPYGSWNYCEKSVCNLSKNTIWKQITTDNLVAKYSDGLYAIYQRTQSESKSQHTWVW